MISGGLRIWANGIASTPCSVGSAASMPPCLIALPEGGAKRWHK